MNIDIIGTGDVFSERLSPCMVVNKQIVFDMPNGSIKEMHKQEILIKNIDIVLISHFHADHCFDIPFFFLEKNLEKKIKKKTVFIGPIGLEKHINNLLNIAYPTINWEVVKKNINFEVIEVNEDFYNIEIDKYNIKCLKMEHSLNEICLGYIVSCKGKKVGFTGDSRLCTNVEYIVKNTEVCFVDMSSEESTETHMGIKDVEYLNNCDNNCRIYPIHTSNSVLDIYKEKGYKVIEQGESVIV